ncbi:MAG: hypothetical protein ABIG65_01800 [Patescibacteria group bacterium]
MTKLINLVKNTLYIKIGNIKLSNPRQFMAMIGMMGGLLSPLAMAQIPTALADEGAVNGDRAFLTVQAVTLDEKNSNDIMWQDNIFAAISQRGLAASAPVKTTVETQGRVVIVTAYSSTPDQTDSSPFITANGSRVRDGIVAANFLPFGTKVKFPEYSGDKIYTVQDRMAKKNSHKIDIWMPTRHAALDFGVKKLAYEVVE